MSIIGSPIQKMYKNDGYMLIFTNFAYL